METKIKTLKNRGFLLNWKPENSIVLFDLGDEKNYNHLTISSFLFNSNSENAFSGLKKVFK